MPTLSSPLLAAIKASLADAGAAWQMTAVMATPHQEQVMAGDPPAPATVTKTSKTYQITSGPLGATLIAMAELDDADALEQLVVMFRGSGWTTADEDLFGTLEDMAAECLATREAELLELLT